MEEFTALWTAAQPTVSAFISSLVTDVHQSADVLQITATTLVRKFCQFDRNGSFVGWALGVARYEVLKHRRTYARDRHVFSDELVEQIGTVHERLAPESDLRRRALMDCLREVDGRRRRAILLRYVDDLKPTAVASRLGMKPSAARLLLHRIRVALRHCVDRRVREMERA
jgi:RNA polymerase sigma-70 factor (ECF subfamily)